MNTIYIIFITDGGLSYSSLCRLRFARAARANCGDFINMTSLLLLFGSLAFSTVRVFQLARPHEAGTSAASERVNLIGMTAVPIVNLH
jgi:hypothetical protein